MMPNPAALAALTAAVDLTRSHPHAPLLDVLDIVMNDRASEVLEFGGQAAPGID